MLSLELGRKALEETIKEGASYADIRIGKIFDENLTVKRGMPERVTLLQKSGFCVRVIAKGAWGFAGSVDLTEKEVVETTRRAAKIALASSRLKKKDVALTTPTARRDKYTTPLKKDPFKVPLEEKMDTLLQAERTVAGHSNLIRTSSAFFRAVREEKLFMDTDGAEIIQEITYSIL